MGLPLCDLGEPLGVLLLPLQWQEGQEGRVISAQQLVKPRQGGRVGGPWSELLMPSTSQHLQITGTDLERGDPGMPGWLSWLSI